MADVMKRVAGPVALSTTATTVYTVPALTTTSILNIHAANVGAVQAVFTISIGADATGTRFFADVPVDPGTAFDWSGTVVVTAGEIVQADTSIDAAITLTLTGVETT